jgi:hypothetical protein
MSKNRCFASEEDLQSYLSKFIEVLKNCILSIKFEDGKPTTNNDYTKRLGAISNDILKCTINNMPIKTYANSTDVLILVAISTIDYVSRVAKNLHITDGHLGAGNVDLDQVVGEIANKIYKSPCYYTYVYTIPGAQFALESNVKVSNSISISMTNLCGEPKAAGLLATFSQQEQGTSVDACVTKTCPCVLIKVPGLCGGVESNLGSVRADSLFKQFFMISCILGLIKMNHYGRIDITDIDKDIRRFITGEGVASVKSTLQYVLINAIQNSYITKLGLEVLSDVKKNHEVINLELQMISELLDVESEENMRICSSCSWLFEAYFTDNKTSSFVFTSLAIEAMFGDKDSSRNTKEVMASRFAYTVTRNYKERDFVYGLYKDFYDKRSIIVHGSKAIISEEEEGLLMYIQSRFRHLLSQTIEDRINILSKVERTTR